MSDGIALEDMSEYAQGVVRALSLKPHPEGGWYRQTWASTGVARNDGRDSDVQAGEFSARPLATLIYFLLAQGDASAWHKVDADEIWLWHGPGTVTLELGGYGDAPSTDPAQITTVTLGQGLHGAQTVAGTHASDTTKAVSTADANTPATSCAEPVGQLVIPEGCWQRTIAGTDDALVSCVVSPGFTFDGFTLE